MQEISLALTSPLFWFSSLLVALLVNLLSAYAKPCLDRGFSLVSTSWRNRTKANAEKFRAALEYLLQNEDKLHRLYQQEARLRSQAILFLLMAVIMILVMTYVAVIDVRVATAGIEVRSWPISKIYVLRVFSVFVFVLFVFMLMSLTEAMRIAGLVRATWRALDEIEFNSKNHACDRE